MLTLFYQFQDFLQSGAVFLFFAAMTLVVLSWLSKVLLRPFYRNATEPHEPTVGVVIPVAGEAPEVFEACLRSVLAAAPDSVVVVQNGVLDERLRLLTADLAAKTNLRVFYEFLPEPNKREAVALGLTLLSQEIVVLVDSDTFWDRQTLGELVKPFRDPRVGGVTGTQRIRLRSGTLIEKWCQWFELLRSQYQLPAMSAMGTVGCLPGRTIAFRSEILTAVMPAFLSEKFLGVHIEVSDDRSLTNLTLKQGSKTVFQSSSRVETLAPQDIKTFVRQQYRWARGSQYNTLRMIPWMLVHARYLLFLYLVDLLVPIVLLANAVAWAIIPWVPSRWLDGAFADAINAALVNGVLGISVLLASALVASWAFLAMRTSRVLAESPRMFLLLPTFMVLNFLLLVPIRVWGLATCAWNGSWGTRSLPQTRAHRRQKARRIVNFLQMMPTIGVLASLVALVSLGVLA